MPSASSPNIVMQLYITFAVSYNRFNHPHVDIKSLVLNDMEEIRIELHITANFSHFRYSTFSRERRADVGSEGN